MALGMDQPWHSGDNLQRRLLDFHQRHASFPSAEVTEAQSLHVTIIDTIRNELQQNRVALQVEYTGSSYEGIKVPSTDMEFDVMVVLAGGNEVNTREIRPLYAELSTQSASEPLSKVTQGRILMPAKAAEYFFGQLQRVINRHPNLKNIITLRMHGPAVQMDVYRDPSKTRLFYSVDMVPSFQVPRGGRYYYYVAKPFKDDGAEEQSLNTWRLSFSLDEKAKITTIDAGNKCRKQCMRMLKVLRDREAGLRALNSYIIKTAVLTLDNKYSLDWSQTCLGKCFMDVLKFLTKALDEGRLAHFYVRNFNVLGGLSQVHRDNMKFRLRELIRSEQQLLAALRI